MKDLFVVETIEPHQVHYFSNKADQVHFTLMAIDMGLQVKASSSVDPVAKPAIKPILRIIS
jgi:hypothetical protein